MGLPASRGVVAFTALCAATACSPEPPVSPEPRTAASSPSPLATISGRMKSANDRFRAAADEIAANRYPYTKQQQYELLEISEEYAHREKFVRVSLSHERFKDAEEAAAQCEKLVARIEGFVTLGKANVAKVAEAKQAEDAAKLAKEKEQDEKANEVEKMKSDLAVAEALCDDITACQKACAGSDSYACIALGGRYWEGKGIAKDLSKGTVMYRKACAANNKLACTMMRSLQEKAGACSGVNDCSEACDRDLHEGCTRLFASASRR